MTVRSSHPISDYYLAHSVSEAHGRNVVNVILVDFRALDTLGEITVLAIAAIGVYSLLTLRPSKQADGQDDAANGAADSLTKGSPETRCDNASGHASEPEGA